MLICYVASFKLAIRYTKDCFVHGSYIISLITFQLKLRIVYYNKVYIINTT